MLSARAGAALGVLVVLIAILALPFKDWVTQRARIADLSAQVAWHNERVAQLETSLERWNDPAYVEAQARSRLHFVRPGQVGYTVITDQQTEEEAGSDSRPMPRVPADEPWWGAVWSTVQQAADPQTQESLTQAPAPAQPAPSYGQ